MTIYDIPGIVKSSLYLAVSPGNIKAGFRNLSLHDEEFTRAYITDRPLLLWLKQLPTATRIPKDVD